MRGSVEREDEVWAAVSSGAAGTVQPVLPPRIAPDTFAWVRHKEDEGAWWVEYVDGDSAETVLAVADQLVRSDT